MKERRRVRHFTLYQTLWIIALFIVFLILLKSLYTLYMRYSESTAEMRHSEALLSDLTNREASLKKSINDLKTERGQEEELRTRYNASKDGEELVVIVDDKGTTTTDESTSTASWWQSAWNFFFK